MDTTELKKMLKNSTAVLILDNGEPSFVVLGYDSYKNLLSGQDKEIKINHSGNGRSNPLKIQETNDDNDNRFQYRISEKETELLERINKEILALKSEIEKEEKSREIPAID